MYLGGDYKDKYSGELLELKFDTLQNKQRLFCKACNMFVVAIKSTLDSHSVSTAHKKNIKGLGNYETQVF